MTPITPVAIPWPAEHRPVPHSVVHAADAPLPKADALVVTWTAGEARTMGQLFAGQPLERWYPYQHNVASFIPNVTGPKAPFNGAGVYRHSLGLWCMVKLGSVSVLVLKSGLHPAYDGPAVPMLDLWRQLVTEVQPKLCITTGTGGGIGADIQLGDVVVAGSVLFDATGQFRDKPWAHDRYACSPVNERAMRRLIVPSLLEPNGQLLKTPRTPIVIYPSAPGASVVTTDTFAFDDSTNHYRLQGLGKCCDMGDAVLGLALKDWTPLHGTAPAWVAIRNASDPQVVDQNIKSGSGVAERIYETYQDVTTAGSVVATWAAIVSHFTG